MAHFAKIDENNIVQQIIVVSNEDCGNLEFPESESIGQNFINSIGLEGNWKQTSYNSSFRKRYAGMYDVYDESRDAFLPIKPFDSWVLNENTCLWESPIERPNDGKLYMWDEEIINWIEIVETPID
jgi:hypothetical protein